MLYSGAKGTMTPNNRFSGRRCAGPPPLNGSHSAGKTTVVPIEIGTWFRCKSAPLFRVR